MSNNKRKVEQMTPQEVDAASREQGSPPAAAPRTVKEVLEDKAKNSANTGIWKIETMTVVYKSLQNSEEECIIEAPAFFMKKEGENGIRFRHEGTKRGSPTVVYLAATPNQEGEIDHLLYASAPEDDGTVAVYYSSSGSGKTVELAVSSVTRGGHLALLVTLEGDISEDEIRDKLTKEGKENPSTVDTRERNNMAFRKLSEAVVGGLIKDHLDSFFDILSAKNKDGLKLVVGIDEASSCPMIVRSIISNPGGAARALRQSLCSEIKREKTDQAPFAVNALVENISFSFSIAGTGASSATIGSLDTNFERMKPSTVEHPYLYPQKSLEKEGIELRLPGKLSPSVVTMTAIKDHLPILYCMMENARMASIALKALCGLHKSTNATIVEKGIVNNVCRLFISSNALNGISEAPEKKNAVGACALAMMLFQHKTPAFDGGDKNDMAKRKDEYYLKFKCGFDFDLSVTAVFGARDQDAARKKLVSKYGLLEPNNDSTRPFTMRPSQQLIALSLLGVELSQLVRADPFGFEVLSTHTIKAALAASSVVAWKDRKSVKETLELVGCTVDLTATCNDIQVEWNKLQNFFVVRHDFKADLTSRDGMPTRLLNAELEVFFLPKGRAIAQGGAANKGSDRKDVGGSANASGNNVGGSANASGNDGDGTKVLYIDRVYHKDLSDALPPPADSQDLPFRPYSVAERDIPFYPPIAAVNYGNSSLADGFITCFVAKKEWLVEEEGLNGGAATMKWENYPVKFTAMNQAKDKLGRSGAPKGPVPVSKLRAHAARCNDKILDGLFGKQRLLFVSVPSMAKLIAKGPVKVERPWLPRALDRCEILKELMEPLSQQRTLQARQETYTVCVDENGKVIDDDDDDDVTDCVDKTPGEVFDDEN